MSLSFFAASLPRVEVFMSCSINAARWGCWVAMAVAAVGLGARPLSAQVIDHVEEDWELVVAEPYAATNAPQVTATMSPTNSEDGLHMTWEINHKSGAQFVGGGLTMQLWQGEGWLATQRPVASTLMTAAETIRWTQSMKVQGGNLCFEVKDGTSTTWGNFGDGSDKYKANYPYTGTLVGYSPDTSASLSGIGFASNRVTSFVLKRVRYYTTVGTVIEDNTERVVFQRD
jgi:hypothetical protein